MIQKKITRWNKNSIGPLDELKTLQLANRIKMRANQTAENLEKKEADLRDRKWQRGPEALAEQLEYVNTLGMTVEAFRQDSLMESQAILTEYLGDGDPDLTIEKYLNQHPEDDAEKVRFIRANHVVLNYKGFWQFAAPAKKKKKLIIPVNAKQVYLKRGRRATRKSAYHLIMWKAANLRTKEIQRKMLDAFERGNMLEVHELQRQLMTSFGARALAIRKVTTNQGNKTPGVDGIIWRSPNARLEAINELGKIVNNLETYKPGNVKRVWIPRPDGRKRPLGIPTMIDRAVQAVFVMAIDPIVEQISDRHSYGFRKNRSAGNAICELRHILDKPHSPKWVLEADIEKCFDRIDHKVILDLTPTSQTKVIEKWLTAGIMEKGSVTDNVTGTPQGGVISPMLANIALNGIEAAATEWSAKRIAWLWLIRYADDFVVTAPSKEILENEIIPRLKLFLASKGLTLSEAKTKITNLEETGAIFLGWEIRRYPVKTHLNEKSGQDTILIIRPSAKAEASVRDKIKAVIRESGPIEAIIKKINPILRGWTNYFRDSSHSRIAFERLSHFMYNQMMSWAKRRHPTRSKPWIYDKYITKTETRSTIWFGAEEIRLFDPSEATVMKTQRMKTDMNPYSADGESYHIKRTAIKEAEGARRAYYEAQGNLCTECGESLDTEEVVELHHIIPAKDGGTYAQGNIRALHMVCHQKLTYINAQNDEKLVTKLPK